MSNTSDNVYSIGGNSQSEQAEPSTANRGAGMIQMRILIELQVLSYLLARDAGADVDLAVMRQDIADSIT